MGGPRRDAVSVSQGAQGLVWVGYGHQEGQHGRVRGLSAHSAPHPLVAFPASPGTRVQPSGCWAGQEGKLSPVCCPRATPATLPPHAPSFPRGPAARAPRPAGSSSQGQGLRSRFEPTRPARGTTQRCLRVRTAEAGAACGQQGIPATRSRGCPPPSHPQANSWALHTKTGVILLGPRPRVPEACGNQSGCGWWGGSPRERRSE